MMYTKAVKYVIYDETDWPIACLEGQEDNLYLLKTDLVLSVNELISFSKELEKIYKNIQYLQKFNVKKL